MSSRTATSPLYIIVHCRYCTNLAGLSKSKLSFICCTKCEQEENKDKWRSFAVLSVFLATAILFGPFSHGSKIHISPRPPPGHELHTVGAGRGLGGKKKLPNSTTNLCPTHLRQDVCCWNMMHQSNWSFNKSVKPCKKRKNSRAYYARTRDKSGSNFPPFQGNVQIPPFPGTRHSQMPGVCQGGMLKLQFDRYINSL